MKRVVVIVSLGVHFVWEEACILALAMNGRARAHHSMVQVYIHLLAAVTEIDAQMIVS